MRVWAAILLSATAVGCGSGAPEIAVKNRVFYDWPSAASSGSAGGEYEQPYPRLDLQAAPSSLDYMGVTIVRGGVHLSRPKDWRIREASNEPGRAFIQYISPRALSFAIYERPDSPEELWRNVMVRYEREVSSVGAKITGGGVPFATWKGQGRAYTVKRKVDSGKQPFVGYAREILLRGEGRVVLVQMVRQRGELGDIDQEMLRVVSTLEVL